MFIVLSILFSSCDGCSQDSRVINQDSLKVADSCSNAVKFENALLAEAMVNKNYSGELKNYWGSDSTKLDFVHFFKEGKLVKSKFYYQNGQVQEEYNFLCGALHGLQKFYYENGALSKIIPYRYGRTNGIGKLYDEKGTLRQEVTLINDSTAITRNFDSTGKLINQ